MKAKTKTLALILTLAMLSIIMLLARHITVDTERGEVEDSMEDHRMRELIERLEHAYRPPVRFGGEAILYQPKEDKTIRDEILAEGRNIVPYLIERIYSDKYAIRYKCAALLGQIATKDSIIGLIENINQLRSSNDKVDEYLFFVNFSLLRLTGYGDVFPPIVDGDEVKGMYEYWIPWWEAHKDMLEDTETGIVLRHEDGRVTPLPLKKE